MGQSIYQSYKPAGGSGGLYLKIGDGENIKMRIASEPAVFTQEFTDENGETTVSTRYGWVVWNYAEKKAQVFQGGKSIFNQLADLVENWGEPDTFTISIKRTGTMLETRYSVSPLPKSVDLTEAEQAACDLIDLLLAVKGVWLKDAEKKKQVDEVFPVDDNEDVKLEDIPF